MRLTSFGAAVALLFTSAGTSAQETSVAAPEADSGARPRLIYVYAGPDGESHLEELAIVPTAGTLPLNGLRAVAYKPARVEWHVAPQPQFAINLSGELEVEVSDGTKRRIGPGDLVFITDTSGKGHVTRLLSPVTAIFITPTPGFDVRAWAEGRTAGPVAGASAP